MHSRVEVFDDQLRVGLRLTHELHILFSMTACPALVQVSRQCRIAFGCEGIRGLPNTLTETIPFVNQDDATLDLSLRKAEVALRVVMTLKIPQGLT